MSYGNRPLINKDINDFKHAVSSHPTCKDMRVLISDLMYNKSNNIS